MIMTLKEKRYIWRSVAIPNQSEDIINELKKERLFLDVLCWEYTSVFCLDFGRKLWKF